MAASPNLARIISGAMNGSIRLVPKLSGQGESIPFINGASNMAGLLTGIGPFMPVIGRLIDFFQPEDDPDKTARENGLKSMDTLAGALGPEKAAAISAAKIQGPDWLKAYTGNQAEADKIYSNAAARSLAGRNGLTLEGIKNAATQSLLTSMGKTSADFEGMKMQGDIASVQAINQIYNNIINHLAGAYNSGQQLSYNSSAKKQPGFELGSILGNLSGLLGKSGLFG